MKTYLTFAVPLFILVVTLTLNNRFEVIMGVAPFIFFFGTVYVTWKVFRWFVRTLAR